MPFAQPRPTLLPGTAEVSGPAIVIPKLFAFQSYFDSTLLQKALISQPPNELIVKATEEEGQTGGYGVGLHPSSQTPVAIALIGAGGSSSVYILKPGQVFWPQGSPFRGYRWGLPYGWLGGGMATLYVFQTREAEVRWFGNPEIIFHRATFAVKQPTDLTSGGSFNNAPKNWPLRFPWTQALQGSNSVPQQGSAAIAVEPTRVEMVLRTAGAALANPADMRILFQATNDFGLDSTGAVVLTYPVFETVTWGSYANLGTSGNLATADELLERAQGIARLAADDGGVLMVDASGAAALSGLFVDVCRYGRL